MQAKIDLNRLSGHRSSLMLKLMGAFLLVVISGALVIYVLTSQATQNAFRLYTTQNSQNWAERLAPIYSDYYAQANGWQGVDAFKPYGIPAYVSTGMGPDGGSGMGARGRGMGMSGLAGSNPPDRMGYADQRLILADASGQVLSDTNQELVGSQLTSEELESGAAILFNNQLVGTLIVVPSDFQAVADPAHAFLNSVNRSILISVIIAAGFSMVIVFLFSYQITAPIRQMQKAAGAISMGDLSQRVLARSTDELGELALSFNRMASSLQEAELQRRKLLADIAHELRTPLAVIQAHAEGMQDGILPVNITQVNAIHAEALLLGRLIEDLRLISLSEAGQLRLERRLVDLARVLGDAAERARPQCQKKNITLNLRLTENLPKVWIDADRIIQVVNNLLSNALRYTPDGGGISIEAAVAEGMVSVSVSDTGTGIAPEDLPYVFDRFYRVDKSRTRASGGTGLGLSIVKQMVEMHGGTVTVVSPAHSPENSAAQGTRFTFTLPVQR